MSRSKSSISKSSLSDAESYTAIGEFWDSHSLADFWDQTEPAEFEIDIRSDAVYYPIRPELADELRRIAGIRGVPARTLVNQWLQEKAAETRAIGAAE